MPNYKNSKIYRIVCNVTGQQYIGSTTISLASRLCQHKKVYNSVNNCSSRSVLEFNDYSIILIEDYPCERKEQLLQRERFFIESMQCVNINIPTRTKHEWYEDNKQRLIDKQIIWNNNNKDKLKEYKKKFKATKRLEDQKTDLFLEDTLNINDNIKLNMEDIYECNELIDKKILIELIDKNIINNI